MRRPAFTLIEMLAVIVVLMVISAIVAPNLASTLKASQKRDYLESVRRMVGEARQQAMNSGITTSLVADSDGGLQIEQTAEGQQEPTVLSQLAPVPGISPRRFTVGVDEVGAEEWQANFFADGTSDRAGLELDDTGTVWNLLIDKHGMGTLAKGELVPQQDDRWTAGDYVQR